MNFSWPKLKKFSRVGENFTNSICFEFLEQPALIYVLWRGRGGVQRREGEGREMVERGGKEGGGRRGGVSVRAKERAARRKESGEGERWGLRES